MPHLPGPGGFGGPRCTRGTVALEFAIVFPILLLLTLGLIEFARIVWEQTTLDYAVQQAARCAAVDTIDCGTAAQVQQYLTTKTLGLPVTNFSLTTPSCGTQVTAQLGFQFVVPRLLPYSQTLHASACFPT